MLGVADQQRVRLRARASGARRARRRKRRTRGARAGRRDSARPSLRLRRPSPRRARAGRPAACRRRAADEHGRLRALERIGLARQRKGDEGERVGAQRHHDAADQRKAMKRTSAAGLQPGDAERAMRPGMSASAPSACERGQQKQVDPEEGARRSCPRPRPRGAAPPEQPAKKAGSDLRDGRERQQPNRSQRGVARDARIEDSRWPARRRSRRGAIDSTSAPMSPAAALWPPRRRSRRGIDEIVGDGDRQRDALDHDHARSRRKAADHRQQRQRRARRR